MSSTAPAGSRINYSALEGADAARVFDGRHWRPAILCVVMPAGVPRRADTTSRCTARCVQHWEGWRSGMFETCAGE